MAASTELVVRILRLPHARDLDLPARASSGSAGFDLRAAVEETIVLAPGERRLVPTGLVLAIPLGWEGQVRPRSGLALRHGIAILNAPGTIDADYRGEIGVVLANLGTEPFAVRRGDRIAQLLLAPVPPVRWEETASLEDTGRGSGGFGSSGSD